MVDLADYKKGPPWLHARRSTSCTVGTIAPTAAKRVPTSIAKGPNPIQDVSSTDRLHANVQG
jgi:hypothetical protein